jgi:hypothetical protein
MCDDHHAAAASSHGYHNLPTTLPCLTLPSLTHYPPTAVMYVRVSCLCDGARPLPPPLTQLSQDDADKEVTYAMLFFQKNPHADDLVARPRWNSAVRG